MVARMLQIILIGVAAVLLMVALMCAGCRHSRPTYGGAYGDVGGASAGTDSATKATGGACTDTSGDSTEASGARKGGCCGH